MKKLFKITVEKENVSFDLYIKETVKKAFLKVAELQGKANVINVNLKSCKKASEKKAAKEFLAA